MPEGSQNYTEQQFSEWVQKIFEGGYFQAYVKQKLPWLPMTAFDGVAGGPVGSREQSRKIKPESAKELERWLKGIISRDFHPQPMNMSNIVYLGIKPDYRPATAWVTYIIPRDRGWERDLGAPVDDYYIRCVEFNVPVVKPKVKVAGDALKSRSEIENYLASKSDTGIRKIPTTTSDSYWGLEAHMAARTPKGYLIEITNRNFNIVRRYTLDYGYKKETKVMKLQSIPFSRTASKVTPRVCDQAIEWVKQKYDQKGLGE